MKDGPTQWQVKHGIDVYMESNYHIFTSGE